jgi:hypothetical protein
MPFNMSNVGPEIILLNTKKINLQNTIQMFVTGKQIKIKYELPPRHLRKPKMKKNETQV